MIELELTPQIKEWLDTEPSQRDLDAGARLLLQITRNRILDTNIRRNLAAQANVIEYHLNKIYAQRLRDTTREEVRQMMKKISAIDKVRGISKPESTSAKSAFQKGRRADHDELPAEIQQLYMDNADILRRMRDLHTKLRLITPDNSTCPDSDRYPLAKHLIALDTQYRDNWNRYDHYVKGTPVGEVVVATDPRTEQQNAAKLCNLLLGKYIRTPKPEAAKRIRDLYDSIGSPTPKLTEKMRQANLV